MERNRGGRPRHPDVLTPAEWRVLDALREGGTNAEIAARLGISPDAVKYHISNMLGKLDLQGRHELAAWRPAAQRRRLGAVFAVPAALAAIARPLVWVGLGTAAAAGVAVGVITAVAVVAVVLVGVPGNGAPSAVVRLPVAPPVTTSTPAPTPTVAPAAAATPAATATPTPSPSPTPTATPAPSATPTATPTPEPSGPAMRYDRFDPTGETSTPGSYAFLMPDGDATRVVETYEELRTASTVLRVHTVDADGVSRAPLYDGVAVGDLFEWRESDDCFVRYTVAEVMTDPTGTVPRKLLAVEWMTYAFTGCSGAIPAGAASAAFTWGPANLQSPHIIVPVRHGPWQLVPGDWAGAIEPQTLAPGRGEIVRPAETFDMAEARRHRLWRDPALPDRWRLYEASAGFEGMDGVTATYVDAAGYLALEVQISQLNVLGVDWGATTIDSQVLIVETRTVVGRPAYVEYSPNDNRIYSTLVRIHDESTGIEYLVIGIAPSLRGRAIDATIEIARSLFESPNPP